MKHFLCKTFAMPDFSPGSHASSKRHLQTRPEKRWKPSLS